MGAGGKGPLGVQRWMGDFDPAPEKGWGVRYLPDLWSHPLRCALLSPAFEYSDLVPPISTTVD